jgi:hypothetical protein
VVRKRSLVTGAAGLILGLLLCPIGALAQPPAEKAASGVSGASAAQAGTAKSAKPKTIPLDQRPYKIRAWLAAAPQAPIDARGTRILIENWRGLVERFVGPPWKLEVAEGEGPLLAGPLETLEATAVAPLAHGFDKAWLIEIAPLPGSLGVKLSGREYDAATGLLGLVFTQKVRVVEDAPRALLNLVLGMFSPTAEIGAQSQGKVAIRVQGSSLTAANPVGRVVGPNSIFRAARVIYNPDGSVRQITAIPRTYLRVDSRRGDESICEIISRLRDPLTRMVRGKYKVVAVGVKPTSLTTKLRFITAPPENRPAAGYTVTARQAPNGPPRIVGTTDRDGRVELEPRFIDGLAMVRLLAAGVEPLDDFPIIPGEMVGERTVIIDPKAEATSLESKVIALRDQVVDQAATRARLLSLVEPRAKSENWDEVRMLLQEYEKLPKKPLFMDQLTALRADADRTQKEKKRPVLTSTALGLLAETENLTNRYVDDDEFAAYADAYSRYAATAPPDKVKARTLDSERPESALAKANITSAANAGQEELRAGLVEFLSAEVGFRMAIPANTTPEHSSREFTLANGSKVNQNVYQVEDPQRGRFTLTYYELEHPPTRDSSIAKALDGSRKMFLSEGRRSKIINERPITLAGYPGREIEVQIPPVQDGGLKTLSRNRAFLIGNRFYTLSVLGTEAQVRARLAELFLDSFRPTAPVESSAKPLAATPAAAEVRQAQLETRVAPGR